MSARILGLIAIVLGLAKLTSPAVASGLPDWLMVMIAASEIAAGVWLFWRPAVWPAGWRFVVAATGGAYAVLRQRKLCGCLGKWVSLGWREHALLSAFVATVAAWAAFRILARKEVQQS